MVSNTIYICFLLGICLYSSASAVEEQNLKASTNELQNQFNANAKLIEKLEQQIKLINEYKIQVKAFENLTQLDLSKSYPDSCLTYENSSGVHIIEVPNMEPFWVSCSADIAGSGWTVIQRRIDGELSFYRNWESYQQGFGNLSTEFFIGLDKLHAITAFQRYELYICMEDFEGEVRFATYDNFYVGDEDESYKLISLGEFYGDAGDSLTIHMGRKFETFDHDNNSTSDGDINCAAAYTGAWWYESCLESNLNGLYLRGETLDDLHGNGISWDSWHNETDYSLKYVQMMIRPYDYYDAQASSQNN